MKELQETQDDGNVPSASYGKATFPRIPDLQERLRCCFRPQNKVIGYHHWGDLLFLHWRVPTEVLQPLVPKGLTIDTFEGNAFIGLVPFDMTGVRPWWSPIVPGVSNFHETNVRTYVHQNGNNPGVWFFSLDASNSLAVRLARWSWGLNYYRSRMLILRNDQQIAYRSQRLWPGEASPYIDVAARWDEFLPTDHSAGRDNPTVPAESLEFFLGERYLLYTQKGRHLYRGQVYHEPYRLREASVLRCEESLIAACGVPVSGPPEHALFCDGVDVEIFDLERVV